MRQADDGNLDGNGEELATAERPGHGQDVETSPYFLWKGTLGRFLAALLLLPGLPIMAVLVLLVRITSRGPGIYRQRRVGRYGTTFYMYKIRTMRIDAEARSGPTWTQQDDPRITRLGRLLRKLHLDEFPQLFNVMRGEMALIGPRPERPEFTQVLAREIPGYLDRLAVLPGITGLAQINLPPDTDLDSVRRKLVLDLEYVRTASLPVDARMLVCTFLRAVGLQGDYAMRLMRLERRVEIPGGPLRRDPPALVGPEVAPVDSVASSSSTATDATESDSTAKGTAPKGPAPIGTLASNGSAEEAPPRPAATSEERSGVNGRPTPANLASTDREPRKRASEREEAPLNALTIDVEDYYQVSAFEKHIHRDNWDQYETRVAHNTHRLLEILEGRGVRATFFVLGWVAERHPDLVRDIWEAGHEIGSHSYWHRLVYELTPDEFRADLVRSRDVLQDIIGEPVISYRAPSFSITERSTWALEILAEEGFQIDSSIYPIYHDRYGMPGAPADIHPVETAAGRIWEFPLSVVGMGRAKLPVSGGGYFRLYPFSWSRLCLSRINRQRPFIFYLHPWEIDPDQPMLEAGTRASRFRHRVNLPSTEAKLTQLLEAFRFGSVRDVVDSVRGQDTTAGWRVEPIATPETIGRGT